MGELTDWAKKQSPFVTISEGETVIVKYLGFKMVANRFDTDKETVRYLFELQDGTEKPWENGQVQVAKDFDDVKKNDWIKISREGEGQKTRYSIVVLSEKEVAEEVERLAKEAKKAEEETEKMNREIDEAFSE